MNSGDFDVISYFEHKTKIFRNEKVFDPSYVPDVLIHREDELSQLANHFKSLVSRETILSGKHIVVQGSVGIGKTVVVRKFGETIQHYCISKKDDNTSNLIYVHMNCRRYRSWYLILSIILREFVNAFPARGFSNEELIVYLLNILEERSQILLLCLDEVDYLLRDQKSQDVLYSFIREYEGLNANMKGRISLILVSRDPNLFVLMDPAIVSSLSQHLVVFKKYSKEQLFDILIRRAEEGLYESSFSEEIIEVITSISYEKGDVRYAIELLWRAAKIADRERESTINIEHIRMAQASILPLKREIIVDLPSHVKIVLESLALLLQHDLERSSVPISDLREKYEELCSLEGCEPRKYTQFWKYIQSLERHGLVELTVRNRHVNGRSAGRSTFISINNIPLVELLEVIKVK
ncbi:MAG: Cdc6/Cdc18 family protein [Candidatus Hodarchaeales archaeon]